MRKVIKRGKRSKALSEVKPMQGCATGRMCGDFFGICLYFLIKCVAKISRPNVIAKFGVFFDKK